MILPVTDWTLIQSCNDLFIEKLSPSRPIRLIAATAHGQCNCRINGKSQRIAQRQTKQLFA